MVRRSFMNIAHHAVLGLALCALSASIAFGTPLKITITADDLYDVYVDGVLVGSGNHWESPEVWTVDVLNPQVTIAVLAQDMSAASNSGIGLLAKIEVAPGNGGPVYVTDTSWKVSATGPSGWEQTGFDDASWAPPLDEGAYNTIPWAIFGPGDFSVFASTGARWLWRGTPPYVNGYGYLNNGGYQFCYFRKTITLPVPTSAALTSWTELKKRYR